MSQNIERRLIGLQNATGAEVQVTIECTKEVVTGRVTRHAVKPQGSLLINTEYLDRIIIGEIEEAAGS